MASIGRNYNQSVFLAESAFFQIHFLTPFPTLQNRRSKSQIAKNEHGTKSALNAQKALFSQLKTGFVLGIRISN
jgi:hypothetical protein